jgi:drug/metabolite transporter (DMT)-like permease
VFLDRPGGFSRRAGAPGANFGERSGRTKDDKLLNSRMFLGAQFSSAGFSLAAVCCWGTSDFIGGYAARRSNAFVLAAIAHGSGTGLMVTLALLSHAAFPSRVGASWAIAAGLAGGAALAVFYRALSGGQMGLAAPVAAVLSAAVPVALGMVMEGLPGRAPIAGFLFAGAGIWLISRPEGEAPPNGLGLAVLASIGFAGFFLCIKQAGGGSALWIAGIARASSLVLTSAIVLLGASFRGIRRSTAALGGFAGLLDVSGSAMFVRALQTGRLDAAVVLSSLYPAVTVVLARMILKERFTRARTAGILAALVALPLIALH